MTTAEPHQPELPGEDAQPLSPDQAARWAAKSDAVDQLAEAVLRRDREEATQAVERMQSIEVDMKVVLDALHMPKDAGEHAEVLEDILRRIPSGWGRWIRCGAGWYPLLARLHGALRGLDPAYEVWQVKEKFGALRYYFGFSGPRCCRRLQAENPAPDTSDPVAVAEDKTLWGNHDASPEHETEMERLSERWRLAQVLAREAEEASRRTCEVTGGPGLLMAAETGWLRTLDPVHAPEAYVEIVGLLERDNLRYQVEHVKDDPDELRKVIWGLHDDLEHLTKVAHALLEELRHKRASSR